MIWYQSQCQEDKAKKDVISVLDRKIAKVQKCVESAEKDFVRSMLLFHVQTADNNVNSALLFFSSVLYRNKSYFSSETNVPMYIFG